MRTTLDLPEKLLDEAMQASRQQTKTGVIILALNELIRKSRISTIKKYKGKVALDMDLNVIRDRDKSSCHSGAGRNPLFQMSL